MKNRLSLFLLVITFFNIVKTDINIAQVFESEKKHYKKEHKEALDYVEKCLATIFKTYDNASDEKKALDLYMDYPLSFKYKYSFDSKNYEVEYLLGVEYVHIKKLSEKEKAQLIEYAKNAMKDLLNKEVFGTRKISEDITIYFVISKIEKVEEVEEVEGK